jgi:multiple sugar transport system ATP-binding protein
MPRIVLEDVRKSFAAPDGKTVTAAADITLSIADRELLVLVGPSGCGKTTTLRLIAGLETVDAGRILFDGQPVTALPPGDRDAAMVFQSHALFPHLTAFENLGFGLKLRRVARDEINSRVRELAGLLGVAHCLERKPAQLSGGERQRIALGRALVRRPKILLLDEPLSHLDEPLRAQMRSELLALRSQLDLTILYVTHDQAEAMALGDRVAVMRQGRLQQIGTPREIHDSPANTFVAGFVGSPPMNLIRGTVVHRDGQHSFIGAEAAPDVPSPAFVLPLGDWRPDWFSQNLGRPVLLGLRPEQIALAEGDSPLNPAKPVTSVVKSVQYLGSETILHGVIGGQVVLARTGANRTVRPGQPVTLAFDLKRARLFDAVTGARIL